MAVFRRAIYGAASIYFARPRRRRKSLAEIPPSFFTLALDRSMIFRNLRLVLSATVSSSALRMGTTAANGFPRLITMIGSFLAFSAYSDSGPDAFLNSTFVIANRVTKDERRNRYNLVAFARSQNRASRVVFETPAVCPDKTHADGGA